jgi:hemolysin activation/secretion protein
MHQLPAPQRGLSSRALRALPKHLAWLLAVLPAAHVFGQAVPDAINQEVLREQERARLLREQLERRPDVRLPSGPAAADATRLVFNESPCFTINTIVLDGDAAAQFQWALAAASLAAPWQDDPAVGHCLGPRAIDLVVRRVQNAILARGYVTTRVLVAPQDLKGGTLKLTVIPGRIRAIRALPGSDPRAMLANAVPAAPGDLLNLRAVEQALENFKRVPTADADIQIMPTEGEGAGPGDSDLAIKWKQDKRYRVSLSADDTGSEATGKYQGGVTLSLDHLLGLNDLFYVSINHDLGFDAKVRGTRANALHYSVPYGYWLFGVTASSSAYHQTVAGASQDYRYSGTSWNGDIRIARLVFRDADSKSTVSLRGWERASRNFIDDTEVQVQRRRMGGWELGLEQRENFGAATLEMHLNYRRGSGAFGAERAPEEAFGEGTSRFAVVTADANLSAPFSIAGFKLRYTGAWRFQNNRTELLTQDRFSIGGRHTVRGFDGDNSLVAQRGWLLRNEVGVPLGAAGELYVGLDHGEIGGPSSKNQLGERLTGAVLGLRGQVAGVQYDVFAGAPVHKPDLFKTSGVAAGFSLNRSF